MTDDSDISFDDTFLAVGPPPGTDEEAAIEALRRAVLDREPELGAGDVLDERYALLDVLGRGGMGVVWRARDERLDREVALKLLEGHVTTERLARMRREAQSVAQLAHPNVVPVYDVGRHGTRPYLVMELVRGQELGAWMTRDPRPRWQAVLAAFVSAGQGLVAAHDAGLVHRDFKPANVLMGEDGRPRVVDFGLACYRDDVVSEPDSMPALSDASLTLTGVAVGTPSYMAPEQHEGQDSTAATDIFGFAVSLYEGLYGERPYRGRSLVELFEAKRAGPPASAPSSDVPRAVFEAVVRGLAPDPEQRWSSMRAFVAALDRTTPPRRSMVVGIALVAVGGLAWLGWRPTDDEACRRRVVVIVVIVVIVVAGHVRVAAGVAVGRRRTGLARSTVVPARVAPEQAQREQHRRAPEIHRLLGDGDGWLDRHVVHQHVRAAAKPVQAGVDFSPRIALAPRITRFAGVRLAAPA